MKRTVAAFTILLGLTAIMLGLYVNDFKYLSDMLGSYVIPVPFP